MDVEPEIAKFVLYRTYDDVDEGLLMSNVFWFLVLVVVLYLVFVLKIGPDLMKDRKPLQLKTILLVYNAAQVVMSAIIAILCFLHLAKVGIIARKAPQQDPELRKLMALSSQAFYLGKFTELLDTVFFIFRKKFNQVSFLHVYHHSSVIIGTWMIAKYGLSHTGCWGAFMNALVHVVMYFYYFMAAMGPQYQKYLTWKKYMTAFQMIQFATVFIHQTVSLLYTKGEHSLTGILYVYFSSIVFFSLFFNFYQQNYRKKGTKCDVNGNIKKIH